MALAQLLDVCFLHAHNARHSTPQTTATRPRPETNRRCHAYFGFIDVEAVAQFESILIANKIEGTESVFLDAFYDTPTLNLLEKQACLRKRDGKWSLRQWSDLSWPHTPDAKPVELTYEVDEPKILQKLNELKPTPKHVDKATARDLFLQHCPRLIATFPTLRHSYPLPGTDLVINVDTIVKDATSMWTVGTISSSNHKDTPLSPLLNKLVGLQQVVVTPSLSELFFMLSSTSTTSQDIRDRLPSSTATYKPPAAPFAISQAFPLSQWEAARDLALEARIPFALAFSYLTELADMAEDDSADTEDQAPPK